MINQPSDLLTELANDFESVNVIDLIKLKLIIEVVRQNEDELQKLQEYFNETGQ